MTRASFNGGTGGTTAQPTPQERAAAGDQHVAATTLQTQHEHAASNNKALLASENHGSPAIAATSKPGEFTGKGVVAAREANPRTTLPGTTPTGTGGPSGKEKSTINSANPVTPLDTEAKPITTVSPKATGTSATNGGSQLKPLNAEAKPIVAAPSPKPATPSVAVAHPAVKPSVPPRKDAVKKPPA